MVRKATEGRADIEEREMARRQEKHQWKAKWITKN